MITSIAWWTLNGVYWTSLILQIRWWPKWICTLIQALASTGWLILAIIDGTPWIIALFVVLAVLNWIDFWWNRPRGKGRRTAKLIGAKARAVRDALVAAMPKPSTVPAPA